MQRWYRAESRRAPARRNWRGKSTAARNAGQLAPGSAGARPTAGRSFFPQDEILDLGPEDYSPALVRKIVRHGAKDPFEEASEDLREDVGIRVTPKQVQRITERIGTEWAERRDRDVAAFREGRLARFYAEAPEVAAVMPGALSPDVGPTLVVWPDGGRIQIRESGAPPGVHGPGWREPKYGCCQTLASKQSRKDPDPRPPTAFLDRERVARLVGEVSGGRAPPDIGVRARSIPQSARRIAPDQRRALTRPAKQKRRRRKRRRRREGAPRCLVRTAVATMKRSDRFGELLAMESFRRSLDLARRKAFVGDGEPYNWTIWSEYFRLKGFVAVLDFVHLVTYVYSAAHAVGGPAEKSWARYEKWLCWAWGGEREKLLTALTKASTHAGTPRKSAPESDPRCVLASARTYVVNNLDKMDYPRYRRLGLPTSSAPVESEVKQFNRRVPDALASDCGPALTRREGNREILGRGGGRGGA